MKAVRWFGSNLSRALLGKLLLPAVSILSISCSNAVTEITGSLDQDSNNNNASPVISGANCGGTVDQDADYLCNTLAATDDDLDPIFWGINSAQNTCLWASVDISTGEITNSSNIHDDFVGSCVISVYAADGLGGQDIYTFAVTVANLVPSLTLTAADPILEDAPLSVIKSDSDVFAKNSNLGTEEGYGTYSLNNAGIPTGVRCVDQAQTLQIDALSGKIEFRPATNWNGTCQVRVRFDDGNGGSVESQFSVTVTAVNDAPVISASCLATATAGSPYSCTISYSDVETTPGTKTHTWSITEVHTCSWLGVAHIVDPGLSSGVVSGTPSAAGSCVLSVKATDSDSGVSNIYTKTITIAPPPQALMVHTGGGSVNLGQILNGGSYPITLTLRNDGTANAHSFSVIGLGTPLNYSGGAFPGTTGTCPSAAAPAIAAGSSCTIVLELNPTASMSYSYALDVNYSDGVGANSTRINVTANSVNPANLSISGLSVIDMGESIRTGVLTVTLTVSNVGQVTATGMSSTNPSLPFTYNGGAYPGVNSGTCSSELAAGDNCSIVVQFAPTTEAYGPYNATIDLNYHNGLNTTSASKDFIADLVAPTVEAVYYANDDWNDYVRNSGSGTGPFDRSDVACDGNEAGTYSSCLHGGEKRKVVLHGINDCSGITVTDSLSAFHWKCIVRSSYNGKFNVAMAVSTGLKANRGLRDLIDFAAIPVNWKSLRVDLTRNGTNFEGTASAVWWSNPVMQLPLNSTGSAIALDGTDSDSALGPDQAYSPKTIFVATSNMDTMGYNLNMDKAAIVTAPNARIRLSSGAAANCNQTSGEVGNGYPQLICIGSQKFIWIEANLSGFESPTHGEDAIAAYFVKFSQIRNSKTFNTEGTGLFLNGSYSNFIYNLSTAKHQYSGVLLEDSDYNTFSDLVLSNNASSLYPLGGLRVVTSNYNSFTKILTAFNYESGVWVEGSDYNKFSHVTSVNNGAITDAAGVYIVNGYYNSISQFAGINNSGHGIYLNGADGAEVANVFMDSSNGASYYDLYDINASVATSYKQSIYFADCYTDSASGITYGAGSCTSLTATINTTQRVSSSTFIGAVNVDDLTNSVDNLGKASLSAISSLFSFLSFDNGYRLWGRLGYTFPDDRETGVCNSVECQIWDFRLTANDTVLKNKNGGASAYLVGALEEVGNCPDSVRGSKVMNADSNNVYLISATELFFDGLGDDDGLCESSEKCVYSPNWGAFQGLADPTLYKTCNFAHDGGPVYNVQMLVAPNN